MASNDLGEERYHYAPTVSGDLLRAIENIRVTNNVATSGSLFSFDLVDIGLSVAGHGPVQLSTTHDTTQSMIELSRARAAKDAEPNTCLNSSHDFEYIASTYVSLGKA
jgi:hypothetical protein